MEDGRCSVNSQTFQLRQDFPLWCVLPLFRPHRLGPSSSELLRPDFHESSINLDYFQRSKSCYVISPVGKRRSSVGIIGLFMLSADICVTMDAIPKFTPE